MSRKDQHKTERRSLALDLEVQELERQLRPGCGTSTTQPRCTCIPSLTTL